MAAIDLNDVNFALRELVRLQLAGELAAEQAWRERQQLLDAVEANWADVPEQVVAADVDIASVADSAAGISERASGGRLWAFTVQWLWPQVRERGLVWALLGLTLATCFYVASL